jgi:hypothetical protein
VPSYLRVMRLSTCWKGWMATATCSDVMPMPRSMTLRRSAPSSMPQVILTGVSRSLNLAALDSRLSSIWRALPLFAAIALMASGLALAATLGQPAEKPILTVTGKISITNKDGAAQFDRAMLESIGLVKFTTSTPWYSEPVSFEGVPLARVMQAVGANGQQLRAVALNDYSAELPMEDIAKYNVILALKRNGEYMPVRDKGPLFIVYPFDSDPMLKNQKFYSRSVWQVARLEVR